MSLNNSVLYWVPTENSPFGLGGTLSRLPTCVCGVDMMLLATIPFPQATTSFNHNQGEDSSSVAQIFYCQNCEDSKGVCSPDGPCYVKYISPRKLRSIQDMLRSTTPTAMDLINRYVDNKYIGELDKTLPEKDLGKVFTAVAENLDDNLEDLEDGNAKHSFISHVAVMGTMCPQPKSYLNEFPIGQGVYTGGVSPVPAPLCPHCAESSDPMQVLLHLDSVAHEDIQFGCMDSFVVWACPHHDHAAFEVYGDVSVIDS